MSLKWCVSVSELELALGQSVTNINVIFLLVTPVIEFIIVVDIPYIIMMLDVMLVVAERNTEPVL